MFHYMAIPYDGSGWAVAPSAKEAIINLIHTKIGIYDFDLYKVPCSMDTHYPINSRVPEVEGVELVFSTSLKF